MRFHLLAAATFAAFAATAAPASAATSLIAAYDKFVPGQGFDIGLIDTGSGANIPVPAGVNTTMDEFHPALSANGRFLVFTRTQLQPQLNGNIVPPGNRSVVMVDRSTGTVRDPLGATSDGSTSSGGSGATITPGPNGTDRLAFGLRVATPVPAGSEPRLVTGARLDPPAFFPNATDHLTTAQLPADERSDGSKLLDVTDAVLARQSGATTHAFTFTRSSPSTGAVDHMTLRLLRRADGANSPTAQDFGLSLHPTVRASDGYTVFQDAAASASGNEIKSVLPGSGGAVENAPAAINSTISDRQPAWSPDGLKLGFVRSVNLEGLRKLMLFDTLAGLQSIPNTGLSIGSPAPTAQLRQFQEIWGSIALATETRPDAVQVTCTLTCTQLLSTSLTTTKLQPVLTGTTSVGIVVAKVTGRTRLFGKSVPRIKPLGRVPLGTARRGRASFKWNGKVGGKTLKAGTYVLVFRALTRKGRVRSTSETIQFKVTRSGKVVSPRIIR